MNLRSWLRRHPVPACVACQCGDDVKQVAIDGSSGRRFAEAEASIRVLDPSRIEALDEKGVVIRAVELDGDPDELPETVSPTTGEISDDPDVRIAQLLIDAADRAAARHADAYREAFAAMQELASMNAKIAQEAVHAWMQSVKGAAKIVSESATPKSGELDDMIEKLLAEAMSKKLASEMTTKAKPAAPNGETPAKKE